MATQGPDQPPPWERELAHTLSTIVPLHKRPVHDATTPCIVNMVSTVCILPQQQSEPVYRLPLEALSMTLGPCSQYAPVQFAANILKLTNSTAESTALVFSSGKLVLVSALTAQHTRYVSQLFRVIIEQIQCMMKTDDDILLSTLDGRTVFQRNVTHNIVGHGDLGARVDLRALRDANPESVKWLPDLFPAAKCSVWLTPDNACHCREQPAEDDDDEDIGALIPLPPNKKRKKVVPGKQKCKCTIKCLIFDTGAIVLTGGRAVRDVNSVFYRMKRLVPQFRSDAKVVPREDRFYQRLGSMMVARGGSTGGVRKAEEEMKPSEAISLVLTGARSSFKKPKRVGTTTTATLSTATPLMLLADAGRLADVEMTLAMEPDEAARTDGNGRTALERLLASDVPLTPEQQAVVAFLRKS